MKDLVIHLLLPPGGPLLLALAGIGLAWRWRRAGLGLAIASLLLALLLSIEGVVEPLAAAYTQTRPSRETLQAAEAWRGRSDAMVLVLGGGVRRGLRADGGYELSLFTAERLRRGQWWSKRLGLPLGFTGGSLFADEPQRPAEAVAVRRHLAELGWPPLRLAEAASANTRENASLSAPLLRAQGIRRVLLVTDDLHMPRALQHFRAAAPDLELLPAPLAREPEAGWHWTDWLPSQRGAQRGSYLAYELLARWTGR